MVYPVALIPLVCASKQKHICTNPLKILPRRGKIYLIALIDRLLSNNVTWLFDEQVLELQEKLEIEMEGLSGLQKKADNINSIR